MITKKRDQPHRDPVQQYLPGLILNTMLGIIRELGDPYVAKPGLGGMTAYPLIAMAGRPSRPRSYRPRRYRYAAGAYCCLSCFLGKVKFFVPEMKCF